MAESERTRDIEAEIGRFTVLFSQLQHMTELILVAVVSRPLRPGEDTMSLPAWALVNQHTARQSADALFALAHRLCGESWSEDDRALVKRLRTEYTDLIEDRNRLAHRVWEFDMPGAPLPEQYDVALRRVGFSPKSGELHEPDRWTTANVAAFADDAFRLREVVSILGLIMVAKVRAEVSMGSPSTHFELGPDDMIRLTRPRRAGF